MLQEKHRSGVRLLAINPDGDRYAATCACGWWAPQRGYGAAQSYGRGHVASARRAELLSDQA